MYNGTSNFYGRNETMSQTILMTELNKLLRKNEQRYYLDGILNKARVIEDLHSYQPDLIRLLSESEIVNKHFIVEINGNKIIKINDLIEIFEMNEYWDDSYTAYENKIGLTSNRNFLSDQTEVVLDFPYKDTVLKASMSTEERENEDLLPEEPFLNEKMAREEIDTLLDKKILVNAKKYDGESNQEISEFSEDDNLVIKGNNLLALHTIKDTYSDKIKMIFIDPPYYFRKTKPSDAFLYNSNFKMSTWLTFMKNRLEIAYNLMNAEGILFITISDEGAHYLKVLVDDIFGIDNFIADVTWESRTSVSSDGLMSMNSNHVLVYAKNIQNIDKNSFRQALDIESFKYDDNDGRGPYRIEPFDAPEIRKNLEYPIENPNTGEIYYPPTGRHWRTTEEKYRELLAEDRIKFGVTGEAKPQLKSYYSEVKEAGKGKTASSIWHNINNVNWFETNTNTSATKHLQNLFGYDAFSNPKPEALVQRAIELATDKGDIVLDFFMGSATTQAAAHKMNRRYIGIEQMDYINSISVPRLQKVIEGEQGGISKIENWQGGGSFIYVELLEKNTGYLKDILNAKSSDQLRKIYNLMLEYADFDFRIDLEKVEDQVWRSSLEEQKRRLVKIIDKNQLYYNYSEINDENVRDLISDSDYAFNKSFYSGIGDDDE